MFRLKKLNLLRILKTEDNQRFKKIIIKEIAKLYYNNI